MQDWIKNGAIRKSLMIAYRTGYFELTSSAHSSWFAAMDMAVDATLLRQVELTGGNTGVSRYELTFVGRAVAECCLYYEYLLNEQRQRMQTEHLKDKEEIAQQILDVIGVDVHSLR